jgi:hypothetical protein
VLIYGCDVAEHPDGKALVAVLSRLTGADVSASDDATGAAELGANWTVEFQVGLVESNPAISVSAQLDRRQVLAAPVATNDSYSVNEDSTVTLTPVTTNVVDWYELDNTGSSQTTKDSVPPANTGRRGGTGGADRTDPTRTTGSVGSGVLSFDGVNDYVNTPTTVVKTANNFTISAWLRADTTTNQHHILWQGYGAGTDMEIRPSTRAPLRR